MWPVLKSTLESNLLEDTNESYRLFHGRGGAFPGLEWLVIDLIAPYVLITSYHQFDRTLLNELVVFFKKKVPSLKGVMHRERQLNMTFYHTLYGEFVRDHLISEHGLQYHIQLGKNQNIGFFFDMRDLRKRVIEEAHDARVLNLFSYTCSFSVAARSGGASHVLNVDMNSNVLTVGRENHKANELNDKHVQFQKFNILKSFGAFKRTGPFDLLIVDPPSNQGKSFQVEKDYPKILRRIHEWMSPGAVAYLCLNSPDITMDDFSEMVNEHSKIVIDEVIEPTGIFEGNSLKVIRCIH